MTTLWQRGLQWCRTSKPMKRGSFMAGDYVKKSGRKRSEGRASGTPKWRLMVQLTRGF